MTLRSVRFVAVAATALALAVVPAGRASAAAPANDDFADATPLSSTLPTSVDTGDPAGATVESWETDVDQNSYSGTQWYRYSATTGGLVQFDTAASVKQGSRGICVFRGTGTHESLRALGCVKEPSLDMAPFHPPVRVETVAGSTYWIQVLTEDAATGGGPQTLSLRRISHSYPVIANKGVFQIRDSFSTGIATRSVRYGSASDTPVMGDWDGDGTSTVGVVRGNLWLLNDANDSSPADRVFRFGSASDVKLVGDWDGNGTYTPGVFRREGKYGRYYLRNSNTAGPADVVGNGFGAKYEPIVGDFNGYGRSSVGAFHDGQFLWSGVEIDQALRFGSAGDRPITGDWDNDGLTSFGVVRGHTWYLANKQYSPGKADTTFVYGSNTCQRALTLTQAVARATCDR